MVKSPTFPNVFCHTKRPDWGVGILSGEGEGKRTYLFEDGEERTLSATGVQLMRKVERLDAEQQQTCTHLLSLLAKRAGRRDAGAPTRSAVDAQLARFHKKYHGGFFGDGWRNAAKTAFAGQVRGGVMARTQERLGSERVAELLEKRNFAELWDDALAMLSASGLAAGELQPARLPAEHRLLAEALADLLHGKQSYDHRFERWIATYTSVFKRAPSWQTATALPAMLAPTEHVYVEPTAFRKQLKLLALPSAFGTRPSGATYVRCLAAAKSLANRLATHGEVPRDLLDVHDFVRATV
jgi:hypothetical protein